MTHSTTEAEALKYIRDYGYESAIRILRHMYTDAKRHGEREVRSRVAAILLHVFELREDERDSAMEAL